MRHAVFVVALFALPFAGCRRECPPANIVVVRPLDSGPPNADYDAAAKQTPCQRACFQLGFLGCPEAADVPGGEACVETCNKLMKGVASSFSPLCVERAQSKEDVRKCNVRCGAK